MRCASVDVAPFNLLFQPSLTLWQDWICAAPSVRQSFRFFQRTRRPPTNRNNSVSARARQPFHPTTTSPDGAPSCQRTLALNADAIADILAVNRDAWYAIVEGLPGWGHELD